MKIIVLSNGQQCFVDDEDFEWLNKFKWNASKRKYTTYVHRTFIGKGVRKCILMHREILEAPKGLEVDHIDGDGLNNQRSNLRLATISQNRSHLIHFYPNKTSRFKGVSWKKSKKRWYADIQINKNPIWLGGFKDEEVAARAYDFAAKKHFGEFAHTNFP